MHYSAFMRPVGNALSSCCSTLLSELCPSPVYRRPHQPFGSKLTRRPHQPAPFPQQLAHRLQPVDSSLKPTAIRRPHHQAVQLSPHWPIVQPVSLHLSQNLIAEFQKYHISALPCDLPLVQTPIDAANIFQPQEAPRSESTKLILIDGKAVVYRAYYKLMAKLQHGGQMSDTAGDSDWVLTVFTAISTILQIFELSPSHIVVVFDHQGLTFRHTIFSDYKLNRGPTPDTVIHSLRYIKPALTAMGIRAVEVPGVEADDVIGTLAVSAIKAKAKVRVVSPDKDFFQIISPSLRLLRFVPRGSEIVSFGLEEFQERFGNLMPSQYIDVLALTGDQVDNIPGVRGIGEKTAVELIKLYGNLENLIKERNSVKGKRASNGLLADKGEVFLSKRLVTLRTDLPHYIVPLGLDDFIYQKPEDGGERFHNLIKAMGSFVDGRHVSDIEKRTKRLWLRY